MTNQRVTVSYDDEKHTLVHLGLKNHGDDSDSAYIRKCIEFYEMNKGGSTGQQLILERLTAIERLIKNGAVVTASDDEPLNDDIFDDLLEQME